ncbi:hypothetical protein RJ640_023400 [Escallonia rubra]|uniref:MULE transposase domain-containing protein n=1 Tax=Escallonia rubra TaxID=112253 RepID=A0AA88URZ1_9ASTE|nr:hypothetical protein RJ640_023400 [Escallonia rubra]
MRWDDSSRLDMRERSEQLLLLLHKRLRMDYELFGNVVTFDTTFATNKDHRPLGVFIGFNHYREQVIFGASLLYDETQASFDCVFNTFLETRKFKKPTTLFTNQDIAMGNAARVVMPELFAMVVSEKRYREVEADYNAKEKMPRRCTRGARDDCTLEDDGLDIHQSECLDISDRYRELWPDAVRLAHKASEFKDGYVIYKTRMKELDKEIEELRKKHYEFMDHGCELNGSKGVDKNAIESLIGNAKGIKERGGPPKKGGKTPNPSQITTIELSSIALGKLTFDTEREKLLHDLQVKPSTSRESLNPSISRKRAVCAVDSRSWRRDHKSGSAIFWEIGETTSICGVS